MTEATDGLTHYMGGPYFEDFKIGDVFGAPSVTVTDGHAALYQAIIGDRLRLPLDHNLCRQVTGSDRALVHPMLVINLVNGQTTYVSQNVKGNLFYRGLMLQLPVFIGDTLTTTTKIVGLRQNRQKTGRPATGMVALEMQTANTDDACVMRYWRCPMIPCRDEKADTGLQNEFDWIPETLDINQLNATLPADWNTSVFAANPLDLPTPTLKVGDKVVVEAQDTVTCAPELVRLTGNIAFTHTDASRSYLGKRLVYGGHTISLAFAQICRAIPNIITLVAWQGCDHLGPVLEEDIIRTEFTVTNETSTACDGLLRELHVQSFAQRWNSESTSYEESQVLDWRLIVWSL